MAKVFIYNKVWPTVMLTLVVMVYMAAVYPCQFHFQEQYQLFLWNEDYAWEVVGVPGGLADYFGRFCTQFYYIHGVGPVIFGLYIGIAQGLLAMNMRNKQMGWQFLSFVPATFLWIYQQNTHALASVSIAYSLALLIAWTVKQVKCPWIHSVTALVMVPIVYWFTGTMVWLYTIIVCIPQKASKSSWTVGIVLLLLTLSQPWMASAICPYPLDALTSGIHYFRFPADHPFLIWFIIGLSATIALIPEFKIYPKAVRIGMPIASIAISTWLVFTQTHPAKDEAMAYSYWGRTQQWDNIIEKANQDSPRTVVGVCMLNLALGMKGELNSRMMDYFQNGAGGLIPAVQNDFVLSPVAGEIYYQLGMTYLAQQQMMEAMEAIPDMQKSAYIYKRLAETNLINGAYAVSYKYLKALQQTLFYKDWATKTLKLLGDEEAINQHPEYGRLRRVAFTENRFSMGSFLEQLQQLCSQCPENKLAAEYLKACLILNKK